MSRILLFGGGGCHDYAKICPLLKSLLTDAGHEVDYVIEDYDAFLGERLQGYDLVLVYHTGGTLSAAQASGLTQWVAAGNGFAGVHSAADSFKANPEYIAMLGGSFVCHPCQRDYIVSLVDATPGIENTLTHPALAGIEGYTVKDWEKWPIYEFAVHDEQYLLDYDPRVELLATTLYKGRACPVAWAKSWGRGRVFYVALGHHLAGCENAFFQKLLVNGCSWAACRPQVSS